MLAGMASGGYRANRGHGFWNSIRAPPGTNGTPVSGSRSGKSNVEPRVRRTACFRAFSRCWGEDGPSDVVCIPNAAARDRPNRPGGRQTRMNALCDTTEVLDSFQRTGRTPPEGEFGGRHSTDRLPPGQDPVRGLEVGCFRNPGHEPQPLVRDVAQVRAVV